MRVDKHFSPDMAFIAFNPNDQCNTMVAPSRRWFYWDCTSHRAVVPIGACYAGTLWLGNAAYLYLSVSFIQMLKVIHVFQHQLDLRYVHLAIHVSLAVQALMPVAVFVVGCAFGTEKYNSGTLINMLIVSLGVAIASYGKLIICGC